MRTKQEYQQQILLKMASGVIGTLMEMEKKTLNVRNIKREIKYIAEKGESKQGEKSSMCMKKRKLMNGCIAQEMKENYF